MPLQYGEFVDRASAALGGAGARLLSAHHQGSYVTGPPWAHEWDAVLFNETPGSVALYAVGSGEHADEATIRTRLDRLAAGLLGAGFLTGPPLRMVAVLAYPQIDSASAKRTSKIIPSTFFPGLRPSTWIVDLASERVYTPGLRRSEEARALQESLNTVEVLDAEGASVIQQRNVERASAYYQLMRGRQPLVTYTLVAINVLLFLLLYANGGPDSERTLRNFGALSPELVRAGQWWRLIASMFLHASVAHILFNMTSLFAIGTLAERFYGHLKFLAIYLGSGLIGSLSSLFYAYATNNLNVLGVGASGAIFGVAGALLTVRFQSSEIIPARLRIQISNSMVPLVAFSLVFAFLTPHVDNAAHLGGLLSGMALSFVFPLTKRVQHAG